MKYIIPKNNQQSFLGLYDLWYEKDGDSDRVERNAIYAALDNLYPTLDINTQNVRVDFSGLTEYPPFVTITKKDQ